MTASHSESQTPIVDRIGKENIRITRVKATRLTWLPPDGSYIEEAGPVACLSRSIGILQVFTDQGIVGIGPGPVKGEQDYAELIGKNPFDVERLNLAPGVDVACWDIIGKAKGEPVYKLLAIDNEPDPRVHVYASGGVNWTFYDKGDGAAYGADALIEKALQYKEMGFDTYKWRPGTDWVEAGMTAAKLGDTVCRRLREAVGPDFRLGIEKKAYDAWTPEECMEIAPILNELGFFFFEQPMMDIGGTQFEDYAKIKELMPDVMLWGGETFKGCQQASPWLEQGIYDAVQSDCFRIGLTENWRIARKAASHGIKLVPHNWTSALGTMCNTHLVAGVPNGYMCEFFVYDNTPWRYGLFQEPHVVENGYLTLDDKPGFGKELIDIDELERQYPYDPSAPVTVPNPRFPHAWDRAKDRERAVRERYT